MAKVNGNLFGSKTKKNKDASLRSMPVLLSKNRQCLGLTSSNRKFRKQPYMNYEKNISLQNYF
jgi:hypothetical protein